MQWTAVGMETWTPQLPISHRLCHAVCGCWYCGLLPPAHAERDILYLSLTGLTAAAASFALPLCAHTHTTHARSTHTVQHQNVSAQAHRQVCCGVSGPQVCQPSRAAGCRQRESTVGAASLGVTTKKALLLHGHGTTTSLPNCYVSLPFSFLATHSTLWAACTTPPSPAACSAGWPAPRSPG